MHRHLSRRPEANARHLRSLPAFVAAAAAITAALLQAACMGCISSSVSWILLFSPGCPLRPSPDEVADPVEPPRPGQDVARVHFGFENAGVQFSIAKPPPSGLPPGSCIIYGSPYHSLVVTQGGRRMKVQSIAELQGLVTIRSTGDALRFVRLRTAPGGGGLIGPGSELMCRADLKRWEKHDAAWGKYYGGRGRSEPCAVSRKAFRGLGLRRPQVISDSSDFLITRWLMQYVPHTNDRVMKLVEERVGQDGMYIRTVLKQQPATPRLQLHEQPVPFPEPNGD